MFIMLHLSSERSKSFFSLGSAHDWNCQLSEMKEEAKLVKKCWLKPFSMKSHTLSHDGWIYDSTTILNSMYYGLMEWCLNTHYTSHTATQTS